MNLYAESSAVLAWLFGEPRSEDVRKILAGAEVVLASELTLMECARVLVRGTATGLISEALAADRRGVLNQVSEHWAILGLDAEICDRVRRPFPIEPIRTLDAIHLASALMARSVVPGTQLLTLDDRIRSCAKALGLEVAPT